MPDLTETAAAAAPPLDIEAIRDLIERHEGSEATAYRDTRGFMTVGVGFNLDAKGAQDAIEALGLNYSAVYAGEVSLTADQIDALLDGTLQAAIDGARACVSNFDSLPSPKQAVVVDMVFNLGTAGFAEFKQTIAAIEKGDYKEAAAQMKDSRWYTQVGNRGVQDVEMMLA